jgi:PEP-CTERM motif
MRGCIVALAAAATMLVGASVKAAPVNLLACPGFEASEGGISAAGGDQTMAQTGSPWSSWNAWAAGAFYTQSVAYSGTQSGKNYSGPNAGIYQSVPATAGLTYEASAYFLNRSGGDALNGAQTDDVRITFKDAGGSNLGGAIVSTPLGASTPLDTWTFASVQAVAPAGTQKVEFMLFFSNPAATGGALYADSTSLTVVPEPATLGVLGLSGLALLSRRRKA